MRSAGFDHVDGAHRVLLIPLKHARPTSPQSHRDLKFCTEAGLSLRCVFARRPEFESNLRFDSLAPQSGHVSNLCGLKRSPLEPLELLSDQRHPHKTGTLIQTGCPVWTRLELDGCGVLDMRRHVNRTDLAARNCRDPAKAFARPTIYPTIVKLLRSHEARRRNRTDEKLPGRPVLSIFPLHPAGIAKADAPGVRRGHVCRPRR